MLAGTRAPGKHLSGPVSYSSDSALPSGRAPQASLRHMILARRVPPRFSMESTHT